MSASASEILAGLYRTERREFTWNKDIWKGKSPECAPIITPKAYKKYKDELGVSIINGYDLLTKHKVYPSDDEIIGWSKMTVGRYYTPNGRMIDGKGLAPDVFVNNVIKMLM